MSAAGVDAPGRVELRFERGVAVVTLDRPAKRNALVGEMREQLRDAIVQAAREPTARALVVTGAGDAFCAGGDVRAMADFRRRGDQRAFHGTLHAGAECALALQAFPGLTVAAVNGVAAGAGFALALNCDVRIASPEARFVASWVGVGLVPDWGASYWLPRLLGPGRAMELVCSRRAVNAQEAHTLGLVSRVVARPQLLSVACEIARDWGGPRTAVRQARALLRKGAAGTLEAALAAETEVQEDLFSGEEVGEGLRAFEEKRPPRFAEPED